MRATQRIGFLLASFVLALGFAAAGAAGEIVVLKGGKSLELAKPYVIKGSQAVMTLKDGTVISVPMAEVDKDATTAARSKASAARQAPAGQPASVTPAEAARAQQSAPKARVKLGDDDVTHGGYDESSPEAVPEGEGSLQVVDWDQTSTGDAVAIKGTLRNTGNVRADNVAMSVSAKDDGGKTIGTTSADIATGALEPGASATFTATLPTSVRAASVRFVPHWTSPAPPKKEKEAEAAAKKPAAPPAAAKPPATASAPEKPEYTPNPNYAPPTASAPTSSPSDSHSGYIPGGHEEEPPPPPPSR